MVIVGVKGELHWFLRSTPAYVEKKDHIKSFVALEKSDKLIQVTSLTSALALAEDYNFENEN